MLEMMPTPGTMRDPVCGMTVDPEARPELRVEHDGETYYFCSKGCMLDFKDDPARYLDSAYTPHM